MDRVSPEMRGRIMSRVKSRDTEIEVVTRPMLEALGFEYQPKGIRGRPDFAHRATKVVIFLEGCFWHGCPEHCRLPETSREFWVRKISRNKARDAEATKLLEQNGCRVIRVWEHDLRHLLGRNKSP